MRRRSCGGGTRSWRGRWRRCGRRWRRARRAETAEEAEERLCVQLGEAEVEAVELAREYQCRVHDLARELAAARLLVSSPSP